MRQVSPHLIEIGTEHQALLEACLEKRSGCIIASNKPLKDMQQALAKQLVVESSDQGTCYLRFYSPMVTRALVDTQHNPTPSWPLADSLYVPHYHLNSWQCMPLNGVRQGITTTMHIQLAKQMQIQRTAYALRLSAAEGEISALTHYRFAQAVVGFAELTGVTFAEKDTWHSRLSDCLPLLSNIDWEAFFSDYQTPALALHALTVRTSQAEMLAPHLQERTHG
ncbi:DUF4123 domain-containing protein [Enterovibrio sp. ZSDZ42]|uniref:DUF4123 domain-containing protein n=2 Tax=Enterovibrio gelatinilyticus TaxID=2899819 RepID=A0ABT5QXX7_9GAMM|nr:DUF4123 domain-containing protein [Enterovibrio sp. ZSDZ42]